MPPYCDICGRTLAEVGICSDCQKNPPRITALRSWAVFEGPLRNVIHQLKYKRNIVLGQVFTDSLIGVIETSAWKIDLIIPVPLGVARQKERGYNQASLLALPLALQRKTQYLPNALKRIRETQTQVALNREQRRQNVAGAFHASPGLVFDKNVLVVDDVTTSGATLNACADALFAAGGKKVYGLTLARAK